MENQFICLLYFKWTSNGSKELFYKAVREIDFKPIVISVESENNESIFDYPYDLSLIKNENWPQIDAVKIKEIGENEIASVKWLQYAVCFDDNFKLSWSDTKIHYFLNNGKMNDFLGHEDFICGYCFDNNDVYVESSRDEDYIRSNFPDRKINVLKDKFGNQIMDISENWGRMVSAGGLEFMAAPIMWFGKRFFNIISKEKLLEFDSSQLLQINSEEVIRINLFDLGEDASTEVNRSKQKNFWRFFDLSKKAKEYEDSKEELQQEMIRELFKYDGKKLTARKGRESL